MNDGSVLHQATVDSLLEAVGGDREFLRELVETFLNDAPEQFASLRKCLSEWDSEGVRRAAHTLKSTSASLGALHLAELGREIEMRASEGKLDLDVDPAESHFELVRQAFDDMLASG